MATEADLAWWTSQSGRDWDQLCQAWVWNICATFGTVVTTPPSAIDAYYRSGIVSSDVWTAPPGAYIYFDIGAYGHIAVAVDDGSGMGSARIQVPWGINAGETDLGAYIAQTGATPLGWSYDNAGNTFPYEPAGGTTPPPREDDLMPWFIRASNGTVVIVTPVGPRYVTPEQLRVYADLGQVKYPPGMDAMDEGPFNAVIASLGGIVD